MTRTTFEPSAELDALAHRTIGAAIEVHRILGPGFLEAVYEEALCVELAIRGIAFARQAPVGIIYKGQAIAESRMDLVVAEQLVVELKAVPQLLPIHLAQTVSYLKAVGQPLALLINFNVLVLPAGIRRVVRSIGSDPED
jgi:GxxExxY protein